MSTNLLERPIFLVGAERSGTTLLRLMLDHHPQICWSNEFEHCIDLVGDDGAFPDLEEYYAFLELHRVFNNAGHAIDRTLDYPHLVDSFLQQMQARRGGTVIGATVHRHYNRLLHVWPDARFIHIIRDGRDVTRSAIGMNWAGNVWIGVDRWIKAENLWSDVAAGLSDDRYIELVYEDLIVDPEATLKRLCEFMGLSYDAAMLTYPENTTYSSPDPKLIQQWRRKLSEREIQLVESRCSEMLAARGYELSGLPPIKVGPLQAFWLNRSSNWKRRWCNVQKMGWRVTILGIIARRIARPLGFKGFDRQVTLEHNRLINTMIK